MRAQLRDGTYTFFRTTAMPPLCHASLYSSRIFTRTRPCLPHLGTGSAAIGHARHLLWPLAIDFCSDSIRKRPFRVLPLLDFYVVFDQPISLSRKRTVGLNENIPREESSSSLKIKERSKNLERVRRRL